MRQEVADLMEQAEADLDTDRLNQEHGKFYAGAFFAQRAAEKALKALHLHQRLEPIFTRNLDRIARALGAPDAVREDAAELTPEYTTSRYPDAANGVPALLYTRNHGERCLQMAERIVAWTKTSLKSTAS